MWSSLGNMFGFGPATIKEVYVHFDKRKLRVTFTDEDYDSRKQVPINTFRLKLSSTLKVPPRELVLYQTNPQRKLSNMSATLEDYGFKTGSDVLAVHVKPPAPKEPTPPAKPSADERIDQIVASVDTDVGDRMRRLLNDGPPADPEQRETEHRVLSEVVLAKTIALDDVEVSTPEERQHRKAAIAQLQKFHRDIDAAIARGPREEATGDAAPKQPTNSSAAEPAAAEPAAAEPAAAEPAKSAAEPATQSSAGASETDARPTGSNSQPRKSKSQSKKKKKGKR